jgi:hypothetical protein
MNENVQMYNSLKVKLAYIAFQNSVGMEKKTLQFTITKSTVYSCFRK